MNAKQLYGSDYKTLQKMRRNQAIQRRRSLESTRMTMVYNKIFAIIGVICVSLAIATMGTCIFMRQFYQREIDKKNTEIAELKLENEALYNEIEEFSDIYNQTVTLLEEASSIAYELDLENESLVNQARELQETINSYEEREELFNKYEWAIIRTDNTRTDITYDRITSLEKLAGEKGLSDDSVNLILALAMTESQGTETAANPESSARGLGQMLESTARFTYEDLMKNGRGTYNHDMAFDGDINITMMCYYLEHLGIKYKNDLNLVLKEYRGEEDPEYFKKVNMYLTKAETDLHSIVLRP